MFRTEDADIVEVNLPLPVAAEPDRTKCLLRLFGHLSMIGSHLTSTHRSLVKFICEVLAVTGGRPAHLMLHLMNRWMRLILCCQFLVLFRFCFEFVGLCIKVLGETFVILCGLRVSDVSLQFLFAQEAAVTSPQEGTGDKDPQ
jgi:hypothetical protein